MSAAPEILPTEQQPRILTLANKITILRILTIPLIVIGLPEHHTAVVYSLGKLTKGEEKSAHLDSGVEPGARMPSWYDSSEAHTR